jgi:trehalose-6-phosphate synthase
MNVGIGYEQTVGRISKWIVGRDDLDEITFESKGICIKLSEIQQLLEEVKELREKVDALWYASGSIAYMQVQKNLNENFGIK